MTLDLSRFRRTETLSAGPMCDSAVAVTMDGAREVEVCVKMFRPDQQQTTKDFAARFERAAIAASSVRSPHVVRWYGHGVVNGRGTFVVERVRGASLRAVLDKLVERQDVVPVPVALAVAQAIARALLDTSTVMVDRSRGTQLVHRGLSPKSVRIGLDGSIRVSELGMGASLDPLAEAKTRLASDVGNYMSPEHFSGDELDARSDLFSWGAILFEMLVGQRARRTPVLRASGKGTSRSIARFRSDLPGPLIELIEHSLELEPAKRIQSADQAIRRLALIPDLPAAAPDVAAFVHHVFGTPASGPSPAYTMVQGAMTPPSSRPPPAPVGGVGAIFGGAAGSGAGAPVVVKSVPTPQPSASPWAEGPGMPPPAGAATVVTGGSPSDRPPMTTSPGMRAWKVAVASQSPAGAHPAAQAAG